MPSGEARLRRLSPADAPRGAALSRDIGWSQNEDTWARLIRWGGDGSLCIAQDDQLLATTIAFHYAPAVSWIGVVITHPAYQRRGLARRLMETALDYLRDKGGRCIMLDASDLGRPLYESMGFRPLYKVHVYGGQVVEPRTSSSIRDVTEADIGGIVRLDEQVFGAERRQMIGDLAAPGQCWVAGEPEAINGYLMLKASNHGINVGPWYHEDADGAEALFRQALASAHGRPIRVYIPEPHRQAQAIVERFGMKPLRFTTRMALGDDPPGAMERQFGVASLATG